jgi:hypothetical protein
MFRTKVVATIDRHDKLFCEDPAIKKYIKEGE